MFFLVVSDCVFYVLLRSLVVIVNTLTSLTCSGVGLCFFFYALLTLILVVLVFFSHVNKVGSYRCCGYANLANI